MAPALEGAADQVGDIPSGDALDELYARARAAVLRTMGEASDAMVLATGNKSELSIGAGILGGDMTGDFAPLRDCPKTLLYQLVRWRNQSEEDDDIPEEVLDRTPTIRSREELTLPSYRELDAIIERFIELGEGVEEIEAAGFDRGDGGERAGPDHRGRAEAAAGGAGGEDHGAGVGQGPAYAGDERVAAVRLSDSATQQNVRIVFRAWLGLAGLVPERGPTVAPRGNVGSPHGAWAHRAPSIVGCRCEPPPRVYSQQVPVVGKMLNCAQREAVHDRCDTCIVSILDNMGGLHQIRLSKRTDRAACAVSPQNIDAEAVLV